MKIFINYEPPQKGVALLKAFLARAAALVLLLTVSFISAQSPGGVTGARLWYKADAGITQSGGFITQWNNQANPGNYNLVQNGGAGTYPAYNNTSNLINFNPSARFDGSNDRLSVSVPFSEVTSGSLPYASSHYIVYRGLSTTNGQLYVSAVNDPSVWNISAGTNGIMLIANKNIPTSAVAVNEIRLQEFDGNTTAANSYLNGVSISSTLSSTVNTSGGSPFFSVGVDPGGTQYSNADIAEIIVFNAAQPANRQRIESYLGLKYGLTLGSPSSVVNYTASDGTTIFWTGNSTYQNNIAGIGRDDDSGLSQKQSQSSNRGIQPIIGNVNIAATNQSNPNSFNTDKNFMVWGSDSGTDAFATPFAFGGLNYRMTRIWRVQETGTVGTVKVALKASDIPSVTNPALLLSPDAVFDGSDTRQTMVLETIGGVQYYTTTVDLTSGQFFSFAGFVAAPGGVLGSSLWLKADSGTSSVTNGGSISQWSDQSFNLNNFIQSTVSNQPLFATNNTDNINYNPVVKIGGSYRLNSSLNVSARDIISVNYPVGGDGIGGVTTAITCNSGYINRLELAGSTSYSGGNTANSYIQATSPSFVVSGKPIISHSSITGTSGTGKWYMNGLSLATSDLTAAPQPFNRLISIGGYVCNNSASQNLPEVIAYNTNLTVGERQRINSYLAIKYGITLDQSTAQNYLASDGSTIFWDATANSTYKNNIAGIGRDDASALSQKQSQSVNSGIQPVMGNGNIFDTNANNTNSFSADKSFAVWGSDTGSTAFATAFAFGGLNNRMARIWKVQETGTVGIVKVALKVNDLPGSVTNPALLVSSDAVFDGSDARTAMTLETIGGVQYYTATVDFTSGQFFSFAGFVTAPGGVLGSAVWLKSDTGITYSSGNNVSRWSNLVNLSNDYLSGTGNVTHNVSTNLWNFNPTLSFLSSTLISQNNVPTANSQDYTKFAVVRSAPGGAGGRSYIESSLTSSGNWNFAFIGSANPTYLPIEHSSSGWTASNFVSGNFYNDFIIATQRMAFNVAAGTWANVNGKTGVKYNQSTAYTANRSVLGSFTSTVSNGLNGYLPEFINYTNALNAQEINRIESYLALKYGVTLDQSTAQNYLAGDGTTVFWNATTNTGYNNNIAGIGRDDASALSQKQSQSVNSGIQPVIGNGNIFDTNANNTNSFGADKTFMMWSSDSGTDAFATPFAFGSSNFRMTRIWRVQETGTVGTVKVALPASQLSVSIAQPILLRSTDTTFDGTDTSLPMALETIGGVEYYTATIDFASGQYFTFAAFVTAPGGVSNGLTLWLDAQKETVGIKSALTNFAGNSISITKAGSGSARVVAGRANFNNQISMSDAGNTFVDNSYFQSSSAVLANGENTFAEFYAFGKPEYPSGIDFDEIVIYNSGNVNSHRIENYNPNSNYAFYDNNYTVSNLAFSTTSFNASNFILSSAHNGTVYKGYSNGFQQNILSPATGISAGGTWRIGTDVFNDGNANWNGVNFNEVVVYSEALSDAEVHKVHSYLALKYGITMDQATATNNFNNGDFASNDFSYWNFSGNLQADGGYAAFNGGNNTPNGVISQSINTVNGQSYTFGGQVARLGVGAGTVQLRLDVIDNVTNSVIATQNLIPASTTPIGFSQSFTGNGNSFSIKFTDISLVTSNVDIYVDNLILTPNASTTGTNYVNSASAIVWDATANAAYNKNIAGIGRDDASALVQKQSQSINTGNQIIMSLATVAASNTANTGSFAADKQFLVWGDNDLSSSSAFTGIPGYNSRLNRIWKAQNTNSLNQNVQVLVPLSLVPATSSLLAGTDATFAGSYQVYNPTGTVTVNSVSYRAFTLPASMVNQPSFYMTFAFYEQSPGGVRGEALWLRGDAGLVSTTLWQDQSGNNKNLRWDINDCYEASRGAMVLGKTLNFNPVASFGDAGWAWGYTQTDISRTNTPDADVALVYKTNTATAQDVWSTDLGGAFDERSLTTTQVANDNTGIAYSGGNSGLATINVASFKNTTAKGSNILINGNNVLNFTGSTKYTGCSTLRLGDVRGAGAVLTGVVGDMVIYKKNITAIERIQLNSYLALKYGITLGRNNNGNATSGEVVSGSVLEGDYLASDGITRIWNSDAGYQNNVVGLGRDDISAFHQRITTSQSATADIITLSTDSNFTNTNQSGGSGHTDIASDKSFFITGNNNAATKFSLKSGLSNGMNALMNRVWKAQVTGTAFDVYIKASASKASYLVYSADATFSSGVTYVALTAGATPGIQIPNGNYFTFAAFLEAPGGVFDESLWLKADAGTSSTTNGTGLSQWDDQSDVGNNATQSNVGNRPVYSNLASSMMNYNPVVSFNGSNYLALKRQLLPIGTTGRSEFAVYAANSGYLLSYGTNANSASYYGLVGRPLGLDSGQSNFQSGGGTSDSNPLMISHLFAGSGGASAFYRFGRAFNSANRSLNTSSSGIAAVGANVWNGGYNTLFNGRIPELIVYPKALNGTERSRVDSYLAIKYGLTLDQTTPQNYLASDGVTVVWTAASGYNTNIIGLAKDRTSGLHQRISGSQMPVRDIITLSTDTNFTNPNQSGAGGHTDIVNDKYFFMTGHNGKAAVFAQKTGLANNLRVVMNRVWRVQQTGTAQNIYINVNNSRAEYLIYSTDPTFTTGITYVPLTSGTTSALQIPTGNYFTFAASATGPGGVTDNLVRWYRADRDVTTGSTLRWADQMQNSDAVQSVAGNQPTYNTTGSSLLNFNSSLTFNAANANYLTFSDAGMASGNTSRSVFGVGRTSVTGGTFEWISSYGTSTGAQNFGLMRSGNNVLVTTFGNNLSPYSSNNPYASNTPVLSYGAASGSTIYGTYNALPVISGSGTVNTVLNAGRIGTRQSLGEYWNGIIGEVVYYNKIPTANEKQRVDSYMGLKYGVSLGTSSNLFTYLASDNTPFWTGDATYQNNIAAIGRDDFSDLQQKQSQSVNSGNQVILGLDTITGSNDTNTGSFDNDLQFLAWGDNNTAGTTAFTILSPYQQRLNRTWKVQNTGSVAKDVQVLIPAAFIRSVGTSSLLYSTSSTFASSNQVFTSSGTATVNGNTYYIYSIPAAQVNTAVFYFTVAYFRPLPGGVDLEKLWLRADDGTSATVDNSSVSQWNDQSGYDNNAVQAVASKQAVYRNNATDNINFNPVMKFTGSSSQNYDFVGLLGAAGFNISGGTSINVFAVSDASAGSRYFLEPKATGNNLLQFRSSSPGNSFISLSNGASANGSLAGIGSSVLYSGLTTTAASTTLFSNVNGKQTGSATTAASWSQAPLSLGAAYNQSAFTTGNIPEVILYVEDLLSNSDRQRVNSYLSLKYGITMDQSTIQDYLASDATVSWAKDAVYKFNIAGIGRDDLTALNQKQSQSVNSGAQVITSLGSIANTNSENTAVFNTDKQFLIWGDDNGSLSTTTTTGNVLASNGNTYTKRMTRVWRMQNKGSFAQDVTVYFPTSAFPSASAAGLIYATTAAKLSDGTATVIPAIGTATVNGTDYYAFPVSAANLAGLSYMSFTTATAVCYKPAVTAGTALSTKAGITSLARAGSAGDNWPMVRNGGWLALEAKTKGMVINRVRFNASNQPVADDDTTLILTSPIEGMMVMDVTNRVFKIYTSKDGGATYAWYAFGEQSCPD